MKIRNVYHYLIERRHGGLVIILCFFLIAWFVTRLALLAKSASLVDFDRSLLLALAWGLLFDIGAALLFVAPLAVLLACLPARIFLHSWTRSLARLGMFIVLALLLFLATSEWLFWDEFNARFNFIAVDYLIYTTEVINNIRESYSMPLVFTAILLGAAVIHLLISRTGCFERWFAGAIETARSRWLCAGVWIGAATVALITLDSEDLPAFANNYHRELAKNGVWAFFAAFRNNELDYDQFYATEPIDQAFKKIRSEITQDGSRLLGTNARETLRMIHNEGTPLRPNVIQITVESLSAEFLGAFNKDSHLTPNLDSIANRSRVFDNFYATGTRTDRGMEALTLSIPPTPGRSLVKRPHNENLFTLGSIFRTRGYDTAFIYGGYGYFDNMNYFFGQNGYRIVDRTAVESKDITFANAWGACDEDIFRWTLREADFACAKGVPFYHFVMTTSNHRPFTYPDGRINLPSKISGRQGAVRYTDYAIGKLLRDAASHPWFTNTVFVIVADHCASVAGKAELPVKNYHIPLLIYSPGGQIAPGHVPDLSSQIDYAPTLLGLLHWSYPSRFYGLDLGNTNGDRRALIGNYQRLGFYKKDFLTVLKPQCGTEEYKLDPLSFAQEHRPPSKAGVEEAIAYYQTGSYLYRKRLFQALSPEENALAATELPPEAPLPLMPRAAAWEN